MRCAWPGSSAVRPGRDAGLIFHSDRGRQYASKDFRDVLTEYGITASMSRRGNCWDNACSETLFGSLKVERFHGQRFNSRRQTKDEVVAWMLWHNRSRRHSTLGYASPMQFEETWLAGQPRQASASSSYGIRNPGARSVQATGAPIAREHRDGAQVRLSTFIPLKIRKRGASKVVARPDGQVEAAGKVTTQHDQSLVVALTRAFYWQQLLDDGVVASGSEIAQREGLHRSTVNELLRLTLLEPAIIQAILAGTRPRCMSLLWFQRNPLPTDWAAQRQILARFDV